MDSYAGDRMYANAAQRVAASYGRGLAGEAVCKTESQRALRAFFSVLYAEIFARAESFGLPVSADTAIMPVEADEKTKKQDVKKKLDRPRGMIQAGLDFLMLAGQHGAVQGQELHAAEYGALVEQSGINKKFLTGLESLGLVVSPAGDSAALRSFRFPEMMAALKELAVGCAGYKEEKLGKFQFARCDFRALQQTIPGALDLFQGIQGAEYDRILALHEYFLARGFKTTCQVGGAHAWVVQYQGDRKVKASPLYQVDYDDRYANPVRLQIKCASTNRIAALLPGQSQALQEDFFKRTFPCRGDECGWCKTKKSLGPTVLDMHGEQRTVCWFSFSEIREINGQAVDLVEQYERMHAELAA